MILLWLRYIWNVAMHYWYNSCCWLNIYENEAMKLQPYWILRDNLWTVTIIKQKGHFCQIFCCKIAPFDQKVGTFSRMLNSLKLSPDTTLIFHLFQTYLYYIKLLLGNIWMIATCWYAIKGEECVVVRNL